MADSKKETFSQMDKFLIEQVEFNKSRDGVNAYREVWAKFAGFLWELYIKLDARFSILDISNTCKTVGADGEPLEYKPAIWSYKKFIEKKYPGISLDAFGTIPDKNYVWTSDFFEYPDEYVKTLYRIMDTSYSPSDDIETLLDDTNVLWLLFSWLHASGSKLPYSTLAQVSLATSKITGVVEAMCILADKQGRQGDRLMQSKKASDKIWAELEQEIIETYYRLDTNGMSTHKIATSIRSKLEERGQRAPAINTIKKILKRNSK